MKEENSDLWPPVTFRIKEELLQVYEAVAQDEETYIESKSEAIRYALDRKFGDSADWERSTYQDDTVDEKFIEYGKQIIGETEDEYVEVTKEFVDDAFELANRVLEEDEEANELAQDFLDRYDK